MSKNNTYIDWKNWDTDSFGKTSQLEETYFNNIVKLLKLKKSSKILEIGFGNGAFLGYAVSQNFNYDGIESNENLVDLAIDNNFSAYTSLDKIDTETKYDLIILFDVIEHINADAVEEFFKEINVHLEEAGSIFLRFPNGSSPLGLGNQHGDVTHCNIVTLPKLNYWCYNSDLKVIFYRGDIRPFIFRHNILKMPSRLIRLFLHILTEKFIRSISSQSKGVLSSNLEVVIKKIK
ncbi:methyltransferase domain-containing protein [Candidatus Pseudothioglobus sp. Uisw_050_01]|uniref:methyltransferase domain-containing protein n=1 Tax=Candidatus Pseudothioglobus sp. Uisw_050_01 TaxID=3230997 RepID=UPI003A8BC56A